ncbi:MAG: polysaccharide deacetylase family protein [Armatimonadota bacterium]
MILPSQFALGTAQLTPVLTYHDIIRKRDSKSLWFDCTVDEFREQLAFLRKRNASFVSVDQLRISLSTGRPLPKNAICITFADNYLGFYKHAWPILKRERIPVAQFVHTDFVGSPVGRPKMSWKELTELDQSGLVTIGSQTCSHPADLTKLSDSQLKHELEDSKKKLELKLGHTVTTIAYPNGKFDSKVANAARKANYLIGFTENLAPAQKRLDMWRVPRYVHTKYQRAWKECFGKS